MKWSQTERPILESSVDITDFLEKQDYLLVPDVCVGDELNFIAIYDHPFIEEYIFHFVLDDMAKVLYANSLPAMLELLLQLSEVLNVHFKTLINIETLKDEECLE